MVTVGVSPEASMWLSWVKGGARAETPDPCAHTNTHYPHHPHTACTGCNATQFETLACSKANDRACQDCKQCGQGLLAGTYAKTNCSTTADADCQRISLV